ncbi:hypothetical protein GCM10009736_45750 [Actinomadura bangladeshensis]
MHKWPRDQAKSSEGEIGGFERFPKPLTCPERRANTVAIDGLDHPRAPVDPGLPPGGPNLRPSAHPDGRAPPLPTT